MMMDVNNIFSAFSRDEESDSGYEDITNSPMFWLGAYKKIVVGGGKSSKKFLEAFKSNNKNMDFEDLEKAGEYVLYNRAWGYIKKIDINNDAHRECILLYMDEYLEVAIKLGISYFSQETIEEYEKCAHLRDILFFINNSKE
jgi:hypothetical protein